MQIILKASVMGVVIVVGNKRNRLGEVAHTSSIVCITTPYKNLCISCSACSEEVGWAYLYRDRIT